MSIREQEKVKEKYYNEAMRYMDNAKECLQKAQKEGNFYNNRKYVKMACGTAYSGMLVALDGFLTLKDVVLPKGKKRKSIEFYHENLAGLDRKMLNTLNCAYEVLQFGYYNGITDAIVVKRGFENAYVLIDKIKPTEHTS